VLDVLKVKIFPELPLILKFVQVKEEPAAKASVCATVLVLANVVNVQLLLIVVTDVPVVPPIVTELNVCPAPGVKVLAVVEVSDKVIFVVPELNVSPVVVPVSHTVPVPDNVHVPEPIVSDLVLLLLEANELADTLNVLPSKVPLVKVIEDVVTKLLPNVAVIPTPSIVKGDAIETLFVLIVPVPAIVIAPVALHTVVAERARPPEIASVPVLLNVNDDPVVVKLLPLKAPVNVIVPAPELPLKKTASSDVGTAAPAVPPDITDQLAVDVVVQLAVPPTQ
jgi:hypothetical protein